MDGVDLQLQIRSAWHGVHTCRGGRGQGVEVGLLFFNGKWNGKILLVGGSLHVSSNSQIGGGVLLCETVCYVPICFNPTQDHLFFFSLLSRFKSRSRVLRGFFCLGERVSGPDLSLSLLIDAYEVWDRERYMTSGSRMSVNTIGTKTPGCVVSQLCLSVYLSQANTYQLNILF